jgi:hypothetical protein
MTTKITIDNIADGTIPDAITKSANDPEINTNPAGGLGTVYLNTTTGEMFSLTDATTNANVWTNIGSGTGGVAPQVYMTATNTNGTETIDGDYKVVTFNTSGTFTPSIGTGLPESYSVEYLVVGGGGGGGRAFAISACGGGGGAGAYRNANSFVVSSTTFPIVVGAGGVGQTTSGTAATNGVASSFSTITSDGGAHADSHGVNTGYANGNASASGSGGAGTPGTGASGGAFGNDGGDTAGSGLSHDDTSCGGGGGASTDGANGITGSRGGNGGAGSTSSITGTSVDYAGGGGGGSSKISGGNGGAGGGGAGGAINSAGSAGFTNRGGGGGGASAGSATNAGGAGGSGVVVIRYKFQ